MTSNTRSNFRDYIYNSKVSLDEKENLLRFCMEFFHIIPSSFFIPGWTTKNGKTLIEHGVAIFSETGSLLLTPSDIIFKVCKQYYTVSSPKWQKTMFPNWKFVSDSDAIALVSEQLLHYFSTYGLEGIGFEAMPYVPTKEAFADCEIQPGFKSYTIFQIVSDEEALSKVEEYLCKVVSPKNEWVKTMIQYLSLLETEPKNLNSFELKIARYDQLGIVPQNGQDWMRYVLYKATGNPLMVKDRKTFNAIKDMGNLQKPGYYYYYLCKIPEKELAKVFFRYKPFFMAMRADHFARPIINRVRKLAEKNHITIPQCTVQNVSNLISNGDITVAYNVIRDGTARQKIKLFNFFNQELNAYVKDADTGAFDRTYNIRNGKTFIRTDVGMTDEKKVLYTEFKNLTFHLIQKQFKDKFKGKTFMLPSYLNYAIPVSEKQFVGNIPWGSFFSIPEKDVMNVAIYWENQKVNGKTTTRTDLDLHMQSLTQSYGWNSSYRSEDRSILYSGDMTDATDGAVEAYRFNSKTDEIFMLTANNYTHIPNAPFQLFISDTKEEKSNTWHTTPMVDVSTAMFPPINMEFEDENSLILGLIYDHAFYFFNGKLGESNVPKRDLYRNYINSIQHKMRNMLTVESLLVLGGATILTENSLKGLTKKEIRDTMKNVIDLTPSVLTANSFIDLVDAGDN